MITKKTLKPGDRGIQKWMRQYGDRLSCVRYKYDRVRMQKCITVELIVKRQPWKPNTKRIPPNKIMYLNVLAHETYIQKIIKQAGGRWRPEKRLWTLPYHKVLALGLEKKIVSN